MPLRVNAHGFSIAGAATATTSATARPTGSGKAPGAMLLSCETRQKAAAGEELPELPFEALRQLLAECPIPSRFLEDHLQGFALDEAGWQPRSAEDLIRYCYYVAGSVGCMMAILMGVPVEDERTLEHASDLGIAFQLSNIARDVREDLDAGRCYLPRDWMNELGVEPAHLFEPENQAALTQMVRRLIDIAEVHEIVRVRRTAPGVQVPAGRPVGTAHLRSNWPQGRVTWKLGLG